MTKERKIKSKKTYGEGTKNVPLKNRGCQNKKD
jgi:hypothetical protein